MRERGAAAEAFGQQQPLRRRQSLGNLLDAAVLVEQAGMGLANLFAGRLQQL